LRSHEAGEPIAQLWLSSFRIAFVGLFGPSSAGVYDDLAERLMPCAVRVQLVSPTKALPVRAGWTYEPKLDGCRVLLGKNGPIVQVRMRGGGLVQRNLSEVVEALAGLCPGHLVFDGELVVVSPDGRTQFEAACSRLRFPRGPKVSVYVFDLLGLEGEDVRGRSLRERKQLLGSVLRPVTKCCDQSRRSMDRRSRWSRL